MPQSWPCPRCETEVPDPGVHRDLPDARGGVRQTCPGCGAGLIRYPDADDPGWQEERERRMGGG